MLRARAPFAFGPFGKTRAVTRMASSFRMVVRFTVANCINFYSLGKEMALGKQLAAEVQKQAKMVDDPLITEFINRLGQTLVRSSDAKVPFTFYVIEGAAPNAFALPGGYIFVYTGLLKIASDESEAAAAMEMTEKAFESLLTRARATLRQSVLGGGIRSGR